MKFNLLKSSTTNASVYIQHLPQSTTNCALYLLLGVLPIEAQIHIKVLNFFRNITDEEKNSPPSEYMRDIRQLAMKEDESSSWVAMVMPRSHWAFLASPMHSRWKLTSIRRCSGDITKPSANNLNSWYLWGSISSMPKIFNACFEIFHEPLAMFCREKCSANIWR